MTLVVVLTSGGPGFASEVPAKYVYDYMFARSESGPGAGCIDDDAADLSSSFLFRGCTLSTAGKKQR